MEIAKNGGIYEIKGIIRTLKEVEEIKEIIKRDDSSELIIKITDSYILPSALIGFLMKQKEENNKEVTLLIKDENLFEMLMDLSLDEEFLIEKV
jgi:ribonuclease HI